jgi:hypothetical protein
VISRLPCCSREFLCSRGVLAFAPGFLGVLLGSWAFCFLPAFTYFPALSVLTRLGGDVPVFLSSSGFLGLFRRGSAPPAFHARPSRLGVCWGVFSIWLSCLPLQSTHVVYIFTASTAAYKGERYAFSPSICAHDNNPDRCGANLIEPCAHVPALPSPVTRDLHCICLYRNAYTTTCRYFGRLCLPTVKRKMPQRHLEN